LRALMTRERWLELTRIVVVGLIALLYRQQMLPLGVAMPLVMVAAIARAALRELETEIAVTA
jgi:hypothetical protein